MNKGKIVKNFREKMARVLVFVMIVSSMVIGSPTMDAQAATKLPTMSKKTADILIGKTYDLNIYNRVKSSIYHWTTDDKTIATVTNKGIVKGIRKGKTVITCTVKTPKKTYTLKSTVTIRKPANKVSIVKKVTMLNVGQKYDLDVVISPKISNDKITWSTSNQFIATVRSNGVVTPKKNGKVTITAKSLSGKKSQITIQVVNKDGTVSTQEQLVKMLGSGASVITIATSSAVKFTIPSGDYSKQTLVVNAPNADIENNGVFKEVKIMKIKADTWYEQAVGNILNVTAPKARIVVSKSARASVLVNNTTDLNLVNNGTISELTLNSAAKVRISGTSKEAIIVNANVKNASLTTSIPLTLTCNEKINLSILPGAEGTVVHVSSEDAIPTITGSVSITVVIGSGDNAVTRIVQPTNTNSSSDTDSVTPTPTPVTPTPTPSVLGKITGQVTVASGSAVTVTGSAVTVTGSAVTVTGSAVTVSGSAVTVSGSAVVVGANVRVLKYDGSVSDAIASIFENPYTMVTSTDQDGKYTINDLTPGNYVVVIAKDGYKVLVQLTTVANNSNTIINAKLIEDNHASTAKGISNGKIKNALTGELVDTSLEFTLNVYKGFNSNSELVATKVVTNAEYSLELDEGYYTIQIIDKRTQAVGVTYATTTTNLVVLGGTTFNDQDLVLSTAKKLGQATFVLTWGENPSDLDSHLIGPVDTDKNYHVYYSNQTYPTNTDNIEQLHLRLDLDDTDSYGPETTSVYVPVAGGIYTFYVYNFSGNDSGTLVNSKAKVVVTTDVGTYTFDVPSGDTQRSWVVCTFNSASGAITPINQLVEEDYLDTYMNRLSN